MFAISLSQLMDSRPVLLIDVVYFIRGKRHVPNRHLIHGANKIARRTRPSKHFGWHTPIADISDTDLKCATIIENMLRDFFPIEVVPDHSFFLTKR